MGLRKNKKQNNEENIILEDKSIIEKVESNKSTNTKSSKRANAELIKFNKISHKSNKTSENFTDFLF